MFGGVKPAEQVASHESDPHITSKLEQVFDLPEQSTPQVPFAEQLSWASVQLFVHTQATVHG